MSNIYQPKRKELANVKVVSTVQYSKNRSAYKFVGSVRRGYTAFVTTQRNKQTGICTFVDDTSSLTKRTKNDITRFFSDNKNRGKHTAYLVVDRNKLVKVKSVSRSTGKGKTI